MDTKQREDRHLKIKHRSGTYPSYIPQASQEGTKPADTIMQDF